MARFAELERSFAPGQYVWPDAAGHAFSSCFIEDVVVAPLVHAGELVDVGVSALRPLTNSPASTDQKTILDPKGSCTVMAGAIVILWSLPSMKRSGRFLASTWLSSFF